MKKVLLLLTLSFLLCTINVTAQQTEDVSFAGNVTESLTDVPVIDKASLLKNPETEITAKELCVYSARLLAFLNDDIDSMPNDNTDFSDVKTYLSAKGVNTDIDLSDANRLVDVSDVVSVLGCIVDDGMLDLTLNEAFSIPDADITQDYYDDALKFLKSGIIEGVDVYGSIGAVNNVKLSDFIKIINRILKEDERIRKDYIAYASDEPFYLIDDYSMSTSGNIGSGWRYDYTGAVNKGGFGVFGKTLTDLSTTDNIKISRKIFTQQDGLIVFESNFTYSYGFEGLNIIFRDSDGEEIFSVGTVASNRFYYGKVSNTYYLSKTNREMSKNGPIRVRVELDLDNKKASFYVTGRQICKDYDLGKVKNLDSVEFVTGDAERLEVTVNQVHMYKNYAVNDFFRVEKPGQKPLGYSTSGAVSIQEIKSQGDGQGDNTSVKIEAVEGVDSFATKTFKQADGKIVAETYILLPERNDGAYFTLSNAGIPVLTVTTKNNAFYFKDKKLIDFASNVWQLIRFEADTSTQKAKIVIRGKTVAEDVPFFVKTKYFDSFSVGILPDSDCVMWFDDVEVYETYDRADYVPVPEPVSNDYYVGMSVCNLWRNGSHYGWSYIHPYHEPITGFYDEGIPEAMDWEIKFLAEHGFDFYNFCWYPHSGYPEAPLKKSGMNDAIHDGYFNAKYADMMKISLMFENSSMRYAGTLDDFWAYIWPYWVEYYFTDDRYFEIEEDGKKYTFLTIYQYLYFVQMCNMDTVFDYVNGTYTYKTGKRETALENTAKVLKEMDAYLVENGISDGLIVCFNDRGDRTEANNDIAKISELFGRDRIGIFPYTWGTSAYGLETQKAYVENAYSISNNNGVDLLALACIGFNRIGWYHEEQYPLISNADLRELLKWFKNDYMPRYSDSTASWKQKYIQFATWNEYGEGHYFYPCDDNGGYDYLDIMAEVLSDVSDSSGNNTMPTEDQKARLRRLYVGDRMHIRRNFDKEFLEDEMSISDTVLQWQWDIGTPMQKRGTSMFEGFSMSGVKESYTNGPKCVSKDPNHFCMFGGCEYEKFYNGILTTTNNDPMIYKYTPGKTIINAEDAQTLSITFSATIPYVTFQVFFITEDESITDYTMSGGRRQFTEKYSYRFDVLSTDKTTYHIKLASNAGWKGNIIGFRIDFGSYKGSEIKLYDVTFSKMNQSKQKPVIKVDNMQYDPVDFGEIRSADKNEFYIAPAESEGLYSMLHIVYDWHKETQKLRFETPNDVTFEFNVGSDKVLVNSKEHTLEKKLELYDGVPVIPLLWILDTAGYDYVYDYTGKVLEITVVDTATRYCDVENGNAEGYNADAFFADDESVGVSVATDSQNAQNKVWLVTGKTNKQSNIACEFDWEESVSYTIDFDARLVTDQKDGVNLYFNAIFLDSANLQTDHKYTENAFNICDEWKHFSFTITTPATLIQDPDNAGIMSFFADVDTSNPVSFEFDNLTVRTKPKAFAFVNGDFEDEDISGWYSDTGILSVQEEDGNKYLHVGAKENGGKWVYLRQKTKFEPGVTYYYSVDVRLGPGEDGRNAVTPVILNARYNDLLRQNVTTNYYDHTYTLGGNGYRLSTSDTWTTFKGSFMISNGYVSSGADNSGYDQITFFSNPVASSTIAVGFDIDNFVVSANYYDIFGEE